MNVATGSPSTKSDPKSMTQIRRGGSPGAARSASLTDSTRSETKFSPDRLYRYWLARIWNDDLPKLLFFMLNPSTADELWNDPTVGGCVDRARAWHYGAVGVINLFGWRSTDPAGLYAATDPVGADNNDTIRTALAWCDTLVCAWGNHGVYLERYYEGLQLIAEADVEPLCLAQNSSGQPTHPLFLERMLLPQQLDLNRLFPGRTR